jgi:hypothetical protein
MQIAYLVVSHRNPAQVLRLVSALREGPSAQVVVRHDQRHSRLAPEAVERAGASAMRDGIDVEWGQFSHLAMLLNAIGQIADERDPDWVLVLSGQDYPLRPLAEIEARLEGALEDAFLGRPWPLATDRLPPAPQDEFFLRYAYFHVRAPRRPRLPGRLRRLAYSREMPPRIGVRRARLPFGPELRCFVSGDWPVLNRRAAAAVLRAARERQALMRYYRRTVAASESFFATVLMNDSTLTVSGDDRRYVRFAPGAANPDVLTSADLGELTSSGAHFARKFDAGADPAVLDRLDERRHSAAPR